MAASVPICLGTARGDEVLLLSTQFAHAAEASKLRQTVLRDFPGGVDLEPQNGYEALAGALRGAGPGQPVVVGALHGELVSLQAAGLLGPSLHAEDWFKARSFTATFADLARMGGDDGGYVPWVYASYLMVAHRSALAYLPPGADIDNLTYAQLAAWGESMAAASGQPRIGLPMGQNGLMHRFVQGFLYPSFTGAMVKGFRGREAVEMWRQMKAMWPSIDQRSLTYDNMSRPLASGEVWVAWDHTARLQPLFTDKDSAFVAFPAPRGPRGRGYMVALAGLAAGPGADPGAARRLIRHLTGIDAQTLILKETGFLPVIDGNLGGRLEAPLAGLVAAARRQTRADETGLASLPASGLGADAQLFNAVYVSVFSEIVLRGQPIEASLERHAAILASAMRRRNFPCPAPDLAEPGPCLMF